MGEKFADSLYQPQKRRREIGHGDASGFGLEGAMRRTGYYSMGERKFPEVIVEGGGLYVFTDTQLLRFYWHSLYGRPSGGVVFLFCVFTGRSAKPTPSGGHIFLCLKKDMEERQTKGAAAPIGSPG